MNTSKVTPKDFVLWVGAMASLYAGVIAFIALMFEYINHTFTGPVTDAYYYVDAYASGVSYQMASLIVLTPVFLILMRAIRKEMMVDSSRRDIWVRRWSLFVTLFVAGATIVIDLIVLLNTFLQGEEMTVAFLLKVLTVFLVVGMGFLHFLADLRGYWEQQPKRARLVNYGVGLLVAVSIIAGFFIVGTPQQVRKMKQDAVRIQDLQNIQWQIVNYWQQKESLPANLDALNDPISNQTLPVDPKTGAKYSYTENGAMAFTLCAEFEYAGGDSGASARALSAGVNDNWQHDAGKQCFERTIDAEKYPPFSKTNIK